MGVRRHVLIAPLSGIPAMASINLKALIARLNKSCKKALEDSAGLCVNRRNYEVTVEHFIQALVDDPQSDLRPILSYFEKDLGRLQKALAEVLDRLPTGNTGRPEAPGPLFRQPE